MFATQKYKVHATAPGPSQYRIDYWFYLQVTLKYFTTEECRKTYENVSTRKLPVGIDEETQVCAGGRNEEKDTCQVSCAKRNEQ